MKSFDYFNEQFGRLHTREHNPDYNLVPLRPLFIKQKFAGIFQQIIAEDLKEIVIASLNLTVFENEVIQINPTEFLMKKIGLTVTDRTNGFPPLRLTPYSTSWNSKTGQANPSRLSAFQNAIQDINKKNDKIIQVLWENRNRGWIDVEPLIVELMNYSYLILKKAS